MSDLNSYAEREAAKSQDLQGFKYFSLQGVREKVADILNLIGRTKGIFSTYSRHDISHVDVMLEILEWLIPPETKEKMTPVEWLMIVLSIYLHDLGMVVTEEEYNKRMENPKFTGFLDSLEKDSEGKDYLARIKNMSDEEKKVFFYQEFVRMQHAARIREWIKGRHSYQWGETVKPIAEEIAGLLKDLPDRFKTNLGDVCESHHKENLDDTDYFPLCERYAGNPKAIANVQYAAIILRTTDLLHITKDRTPSIMYKTLRITDPMGVDEWQKQMGTTSVYMKAREFDPKNTESHVIIIRADFEEERPFFVLSEYIEYAKNQVEQSKRWSDASREKPDGKHYFFPWFSVEPAIRVEGNEPIPIKFELDRGRLLDLLVGHTIYNDPTVAVRELLQNAIDAVRFQHYLECETAPKTGAKPTMEDVRVDWNNEKRELIVEDNGIGMDMDIIKFNLMKVGASYYDTPKFQAEYGDFSPISRFGIGILTSFMVSDNIEIITCREEGGHRIKMSSVQANYLLKKLEPGNECLKGLEPHGTRVRLTLRASIDLEKKSMIDIVRHWAILPACNVLFSENGADPQRLGFDTPAEALHYFYTDELAKSESIWSQETEIIDLSHKNGKESYELAVAVRKSFSPERNFIKRSEKNSGPAVCIEGIRVDESLPGFTGDGGICAILSVKNNKKFRTTVSRSNIEQDEEYLKVGKISAELLYKHLDSEVKRIADLEGEPLSQASTGGQWIYRSIDKAIANDEVRKFMKELYLKLPLMVVENLKENDGEIETNRELITQESLKKLDSFWTIESRLVNYLGILSRDLGRELSLNDFLVKLAPGLQNTRITPIISDAHQFTDSILSSHKVVKVEFSRRHQQLRLKWELCESAEPEIEVSREEINEMGDFFTRAFSIETISYYILLKIFTIPLEGDIQDINAVASKLTAILAPDSKLLFWIKKLKESVIKLSGKNEKFKGRVILLRALLIINCKISPDRHLLSRFRSSTFDGIWQEEIQDINAVLDKQGFDFALPGKLEDVIGAKNTWFNPSDYWFNWEQDYDIY